MSLVFLLGCLVGGALQQVLPGPEAPPASRLGDREPWASRRVGKLPFTEPVPEILPLCHAIVAETLEPEEQARLATAWVYGSIAGWRGGVPLPADPLSALHRHQGGCGERDLLLQQILGCLAIPSRRASFFGVPIQLGHSATEAFFAGDWHFLDSTFGLYFATGSGSRILSIAEARAAYPDLVVMRATVTPWQGRRLGLSALGDLLRRGELYEVSVERQLWDPDDDGRLSAVLEPTYFSSELGAHDSEPRPFSWPTVIDLNLAPEGRLGQADGDGAELRAAVHEMAYGRLYQPVLFALGPEDDEGGLTVAQRFEYLTAVPRRVVLELQLRAPVPAEVRRHLLAEVEHADLHADVLHAEVQVEWGEQSVRIETDALPPLSTLVVRLNDTLLPHQPLRLASVAWRCRGRP
ncbi:MAG: hypothetical protein HY903_14270 [Deltaproteobacteria bacterium]|nr:hypothetical protein [Deltaproteobacteria bacterium]